MIHRQGIATSLWTTSSPIKGQRTGGDSALRRLCSFPAFRLCWIQLAEVSVTVPRARELAEPYHCFRLRNLFRNIAPTIPIFTRRDGNIGRSRRPSITVWRPAALMVCSPSG